MKHKPVPIGVVLTGVLYFGLLSTGSGMNSQAPVQHETQPSLASFWRLHT